MNYKLIPGGLLRSDGAVIPVDDGNLDYIEYLSWVDQGNVPEPAIVPDPRQPFADKIAMLEGASYLNRGSRELQLRIMEKEAASAATAVMMTAEQILAKQPYYIKLKQLDVDIAILRRGLV